MANLIAKNTIQRILDGRFVSHAPGVRFEMIDEEAAQLVRMNAAVYADPENVTHGALFQAPVQVSAPHTPETDETPLETPDIEPEDVVQTAPAPKRTRRAKTSAE